MLTIRFPGGIRAWHFGAMGFALAGLTIAPAAQAGVIQSLQSALVAHYDFEHPLGGNPSVEVDQGPSGTNINLINGGADMRVAGGAWAGSNYALQTKQVTTNPLTPNDDWKAGVYAASPTGVASLSAFAQTAGVTIMGWVKPTDVNPSLNTNTASPTDRYNAVGLMGILQGGTGNNGHNVRALLEIIDVGGTLRLVALARRLDTQSSLTFYATANWMELLPIDEWHHLAATFDFDNGTMALYVDGLAVAGLYTSAGDPWGVIGGAEPDLTSPTNPGGIKIGGSYPQDTQEFNTFNGQFDDLMFFKRSLTADEIQAQYQSFVSEPTALALFAAGLAVLAGIARRRRG